MANDKDFLLKNAVEVGGPTKVTLGTVTNNDIDLATGNYFADTLAANTTYTISNAGDVQSFQLEVTGGSTPFSISSATVIDSYAISSGSYEGVFFKPDGTRMYIMAVNADKVEEYSLSAWDVSTATYTGASINFLSQDGDMNNITFKPDGTRMYLAGGNNGAIYQYNLSTAWNLATASFSNTEFSTSSQTTAPKHCAFKPDGLKMYVSTASGDVYQYTLSTAWDVSTATYDSVSTTLVGGWSIVFSNDGGLLYGMSSTTLGEYLLSTSWDLSTTGSVQETYDVSTEDASPRGLFVRADGEQMFMLGDFNNTVYQYSISATATITWPSSIEWAGGVAPSAPATGETDVFTFVTDDGGTSYVGVKTADNLS